MKLPRRSNAWSVIVVDPLQVRARPIGPGFLGWVAPVAVLALTACAHHPPPSPTSFPPPPVDTSQPLPQQTQLKHGASMQKILEARIADSESFKLLSSEAKAWRDWWVKQSQIYGTKP